MSSKKDRLIIVLGATGFVGGAVLQYLLSQGYKVRGIGRNDCDLSNIEQVKVCFSKIHEPFDLVFASAVLRVPNVADSTGDTNIVFARNVASAVNGHKLGKVIYISTSDVYGRPPSELPLRETSITKPNSDYGRSKLAAESVISALSVPVTILRLPGVFGAGEKTNSLVWQLADKLRNTGKVMLVEGGSNLRSLIYVKDIARLVEHVLNSTAQGVYNVAASERLSILDISKFIALQLKLKFLVENTPTEQPQFDIVFDLTKLKNEFPGYKTTPFALAIGEYLK